MAFEKKKKHAVFGKWSLNLGKILDFFFDKKKELQSILQFMKVLALWHKNQEKCSRFKYWFVKSWPVFGTL